MAVLGRSGISISNIGLGAWSFGSGSYGEVSVSDSFAALDAYVAGGGNFIDTARGYGPSERIIGDWLQARGKRDDVVIASKSWPWQPDKLRGMVETSLSELRTDAIDLLFLHNPPDSIDDMNLALDCLEQLRTEGKIRATGASIKGGNVTPETQALCSQYIASGRCDAIMLIFSIFRQSSRAIFSEAADNNVCLVGRTCLESGLLSGQYQPGHRFPGQWPQGDQRSRWPGEQLDRILAEAQDLKQALVRPPYDNLAQVALRFCLDQEGLGNSVVGGKNARQIEESMAVRDLPPLPADVHALLAERYRNGEDLVNMP